MLPTEANAGHVAPQRKTLLLGSTEGPGSCQSSQWGVDRGPGEGPPPPWQLPGQLGRQRLGAEPQYALLTLSSSERAFHLTWQRRKVLYFPLSHGACQPQGCRSRFLLPLESKSPEQMEKGNAHMQKPRQHPVNPPVPLPCCLWGLLCWPQPLSALCLGFPLRDGTSTHKCVVVAGELTPFTCCAI